MEDIMKPKKFLTALLAAVFAIALCAGLYIIAVQGEPGSDADPLVSLSYVNDVLTPELERYVDEQIALRQQTFKAEFDAKVSAFASAIGQSGGFYAPPGN